MAIYRLRRIDSQVAVEADAPNDDDALAKFAQRLGVALPFDGPAAPKYMMGEVWNRRRSDSPEQSHFTPPESRAVYEVTD